MAQNDDKTGTYDFSENENTGLYGTDADATFAYAPALEDVSRSKRHGIGLGDKITLRGKDYAIIEIISEETGEAVIYKIEDEAKMPFALKLYFEFSNVREEPNEETLSRIKEITDPDILKLYDFGVGSDKHLEKYCYEISDFAEGGDLFAVEDFCTKYTPEFIEKTIVHEIFKGIRRLHEAKIFHCDLKPQNVFFLDQNRTDVIIGDYGSAKSYDLESLNTARKSTVVKGTEAYLAPEQAIGIISESNDYYSFGVILLHLLYPESLAADTNLRLVDRRKINRLKERQYNFHPVFEFDPKHERLNNLIAGLTLHNHQNRWGRKQVEQWIQGNSPEVKYQTGSILPIKLGKATIITDRDLINFIEANPDLWYRDLIGNAYETLKNWLDSYRDIPTRIVFDEMVQFYKPFGTDFVKEAVIRFFQPERRIAVDFDFFDIHNSSDIVKETAKFIAKIDDLWKHSDLDTTAHLERISFYLFQMEFALRQCGKKFPGIYQALGITDKSFDDFKTEIQTRIDPQDSIFTYRRLVNMFYAFNPQRTFRDLNNDSIKTLDELALFYAKNETAFQDSRLTIENEFFLDKVGRKQLANLDYKDFIFEVFKDKAENRIELVGLSFDRSGIYKINYKFFKSLEKFLAQNSVNRDFTSRSTQTERCEIARGFFQKFSEAGEQFINEVCRRHNISRLSDDNLAQIRERFRTDSLDRFLYINTSFLLPKNSIINRAEYSPTKTQRFSVTPKTIQELKDAEEIAKKSFHWKPAAIAGVLSLLITIPLLAWLAFYMGWIPKNGARYITFSKSVKLDGKNFAAGDFLEVSSESEYNTCLQSDNGAKCYPTAKTALMFDRQGSTALDNLGKIDNEFSYERNVFKVTRTARLGNRSYSVGSIVNLTVNSNEQFCFDVPGKNKCFGRKSVCRGNDCNNTIDEYGYSVSNYRGKRLFTFNRNTTFDGLSVKNGTAWEVVKEDYWSNCLKTPGGEKCYLTQAAISRLRQPDVPVVSNFGKIGTRETTISGFGYGTAGFFVLLIAGLLFYSVSRLDKKMRLFVLRNEINTREFSN